LTVDLTLTLNSTPGQITGHISNGTWTSALLADQAAFHAITNPAPYQGQYTAVIPGPPGSGPGPAGDGLALVPVDRGGRWRWSRTRADATVIAQSATLSGNGQCPLYVPLYGGKGALLSWGTFTASPLDLQDSPASWIKPALPLARYYPE